MMDIIKRRRNIDDPWSFLEPDELVSSFNNTHPPVSEGGITDEFI